MAISRTQRISQQISTGKITAVILNSGPSARQGPLCDYSSNVHAVTKGGLPAGNLFVADFQVEAARKAGLGELILTVPPHPGSKILSRYYENTDLHGINVNIHNEDSISGSLGVIGSLCAQGKIDLNKISTLCVLFGDTVHNINLKPILEAHLESGAALTAAVHAISLEARDWDDRSFGTFMLAGMKPRSSFDSFEEFKTELQKFSLASQKSSLPVSMVCEQVKDQNRDINSSDSNLVLSGIIFIDVKLLRDISNIISPAFNDIGFNLLPALGGRAQEFKEYFSMSKALRNVIRNIENGAYPFNAYLLPKKNEDGGELICRDVATPLALLQVNHDVARGLIDTRLVQPGCSFWQKIEDSRTGYKGTSSAYVDPSKIISPEDTTGIVGPLIGSHSNITSHVDYLSIIRDFSMISARSITASLIFGGNERKRVFISEGWDIDHCIVVGPVKIDRSTEYEGFGRNPRLSNLLIFAPYYKNPERWFALPLSQNFADSEENRENGNK